jgi:NADH-quinone oxidoreductase subunit L
LIQLIVFLPLLAALVAGFGNRLIGNNAAKLVTTGALFASCALSWPIFLGFIAGTMEADVHPVLAWIHSGDLAVDWSLRVDALTAVMLVVITTVSALVHLYSWGYMAEDPSQPRFFAYLSLFTFAMLMLVTADNLVQMFFGWEGVGLASYLLIGFWYHKPSANAAAIEGVRGQPRRRLRLQPRHLRDLPRLRHRLDPRNPRRASTWPVRRSASSDALRHDDADLHPPLHRRDGQVGAARPPHLAADAMEGPTPVSALIHAATMVTAGVFMVCRLSPMFETSETALTLVTFVGAATAIFAATVATVQNDIKRVIAYSTCSQLGYMFFAAGVGAYGAAMFHLFTHAFFKALLFLGAGSVIHAMHHEQDMRFYGGLRKHIPLTFWAMMIGTLAITGVGIIQVAGLPSFGFAGFFSKDAIIESAFASGTDAGGIAFAIASSPLC